MHNSGAAMGTQREARFNLRSALIAEHHFSFLLPAIEYAFCRLGVPWGKIPIGPTCAACYSRGASH